MDDAYPVKGTPPDVLGSVFVQAGIHQRTSLRIQEGVKFVAALSYGVFELLQYCRILQCRNILANLLTIGDCA
jgi:hypothetical protein